MVDKTTSVSSPVCTHLFIRRTQSTMQLQMLLFPNALFCSLYERNCVCAVTKIFTKFLSANNFCQLLQVTRKRSCTSAGKAQPQLHFRDDQQRAFGISNISNSAVAGQRSDHSNTKLGRHLVGTLTSY